MIEFDYRKETLRAGDTIFRPVCKAYIMKLGNEWVAEYFYIDSGADYTLIPYRMGKFLGMEKTASDVRDIGGIGGSIGVRFAVAHMKIGVHEFNCTIAWAQVEHVPFLLGRENVFECFDVTFLQRKKKTRFIWHNPHIKKKNEISQC